jgi:hypothetical protein
VQVRRSVTGMPDPTGVLGSFTLSHDNDPLEVSYESAAPQLTLEPGVYFALFAPQAEPAFWLGTEVNYSPAVTTVGFLNPLTRASSVEEISGAARILGEEAPPLGGPPTSKDQCKNDEWQTFNNPSFKNPGRLRLIHRFRRREWR